MQQRVHVLRRSALRSVHLGRHPSQTEGRCCMGWCSLREAVSDLIALFYRLPGQARQWDEISSGVLLPFARQSRSKFTEWAGEFPDLGVGSGKPVSSGQRL